MRVRLAPRQHAAHGLRIQYERRIGAPYGRRGHADGAHLDLAAPFALRQLEHRLLQTGESDGPLCLDGMRAHPLAICVHAAGDIDSGHMSAAVGEQIAQGRVFLAQFAADPGAKQRVHQHIAVSDDFLCRALRHDAHTFVCRAFRIICRAARKRPAAGTDHHRHALIRHHLSQSIAIAAIVAAAAEDAIAPPFSICRKQAMLQRRSGASHQFDLGNAVLMDRACVHRPHFRCCRTFHHSSRSQPHYNERNDIFPSLPFFFSTKRNN